MLTCNLEEMAGRLGVSLPTMRSLIKRYSDFPVVQPGRNGVPWQFDPMAVTDYIAAKRREEAEAKQQRDELLAQVSLPLEETIPPEERPTNAADRLKLAQAMRAEDELAKQRGFLVARTDMRQRLEACWAPLTQEILTLPGRMGRRYNLPAPVVRDMRLTVERALRDMHERLGDLATGGTPPPPEHAEAA